MGFWYWFRVAVMTAGLVVTIICIRNLNQVHPQGEEGSRINLCPTRVARLEAGKIAVFQEGLSWFRDGAKHKEKLDDVAVEKWFSRNCTLTGTRVASPPQVETALKVFFVSGEPRTLLRSSMGDYEWMGLPFRSIQLDDALKELAELPVKESSP